MGGMSEVVQNEIDSVLSKDADQRHRDLQVLRAAFIPNLVRINPKNDQPMRRVAPLADLPAGSHQLIEKMVERRLLVKDHRRIGEDGSTEEVVVEVALESLLRHWTQLVVWLEERLFDLKAADAILRNAANWEENQCEDRYLVLSGTRLQAAEKLADSDDFANHLADAREFLAACRAAEDEEVREAQIARQARLDEAERKTLEAEESARRQKSYAEDISRKSKRLKVVLALTAVTALLAGFLYWKTEEGLRDTTALKLISSSQAILSGITSGGDARAFQQLAAAEHLNNRPDEGVIRTAIATKASTEKIIDAGHGLYSIAFSPRGDRVAAAGISNDIKIWDTATGKPVFPTLVGDQGGRIYSIAYSPDGHLLAAGGDDGTIWLWNVDTGQPIEPPLRTAPGAVRTLAFSPRGPWLASGTGDGSARLWNVETRRWRELNGGQEGVANVAFDPKGEKVATASDDGSILLWPTETADLPKRLKGTSSAGVTNVAFDPEAAVLVSTGKDDTIRMWDLERPNEIPPRNPLNPATSHQDDTFSPAFSRDGRLVTASADHTIRLWNAVTLDPLALLTGHQDAVYSVAFSPDGRHVASASQDHTVRLWNIAAALPLDAGSRAMTGVAFNSDATAHEVMTTSADGTVEIWNTGTSTYVGLTGHNTPVTAVAVSSDGIIASGDQDGLVKLWNPRIRDPIGQPIKAPGAVRDVAFSPNGEEIAVAVDSSVHVWKVDTRQHIEPPLNHTETVNSVAFSPDGTTIATASNNDALAIWAAGDHTRKRELPDHDNDVRDVAFNQDGTVIATAAGDNTVRLWNATTYTSRRLLGHQAPVRSVAFSPDGTRLVSASDDKTLRVWDTAEGHAVGEPLRGHESAVVGVAYGPDGALIASVSDDKTVRLWPGTVTTEMLCTKVTENMSTSQWDEWVAAGIDYQKPCTDLPVRHDDGG
jgi:WD40 repeat protein